MNYNKKSKQELLQLQEELMKEYKEYQEKGLKLDMSRGKPSSEQLDLSMGMLDCLTSKDSLKTQDNTDTRNYGGLDGIVEAKELFANLLDISASEIIVGGNSSLNLMYDTVSRAFNFGFFNSEKPWSKLDKVKFLCPSPGYDRHFAICELFGIEMITVKMNADGPDMDEVEKLIADDDSIKGIWCVPMYSNPEGITYSDEVVKRFANLKPKATDFRILWDNAYCVHHLNENPDQLLNIFDECKKAGTLDNVIMYASTSKISFSGAGVAILASSESNVNFFKKQLSIQTIGPDKINQLRHIKFFKDLDGVKKHMKKHEAIVRPKFEAVLDYLNTEIKPLGIADWKNPNGGYFISVDTMQGCAKRTVELCKEAGVVLTPAGATFPYSKDFEDRNIRIAPTFPPVSELEVAIRLFGLCLKIASVQKLLAE
jgi:DNA-binding transcriptional MocR family regulator